MEMPATCYDCPFCYGCICDKPTMPHCPLQEAPGANAGKWISIKDRTPDEQGDYLIYNGKNVTKGWFAGENGWISLDGSFYADGVVTHFMPLPEPPKEG